jgi:hypothetical protein
VITNTPLGTGFIAIAAGHQNGVALDASGTIHIWGADFDGQVSNAPPGPNFTAIAAGSAHSLAVREKVDINIYNSVLYPANDGSDSNPDDVIPVIVHGCSVDCGSGLAVLDTNDIDLATLRFGPGMGSISPTGQSWFNFDVNGDGLDDALYHFQMSDAAFNKKSCSDTVGILTGELTTGETFTGYDTFVSECTGGCH